MFYYSHLSCSRQKKDRLGECNYLSAFFKCFLIRFLSHTPLSRFFYFFFILQILILMEVSGQNLFPVQYLSQNIGDETDLILLGEPSHREGSVMQAVGDLAVDLLSNKDFSVFAVESSFYDLLKASGLSYDSTKYHHALKEAIYPIWSGSLEFQPLLEFLVANREKIRVIGFDFQIGYIGSEYLIPDIENLFKDLYSREDYDLLDDLISSLYYNKLPSNHNRDSTRYLLNEMVSRVPDKVHSKDSIANWQLILNQLLDLEKWYYESDIESKTKENFKAKDSNARDLAMAETLLKWWENNGFQKIVAWGASLHFASNLKSLKNRELSQFISMGQLLKNELGTRVNTVGSFFGTGEYGYNFDIPDTLTKSSLGTLEQHLINDALPRGFINWAKLNDTQKNFSSIAFDYEELKGNWNDIFDYHLFIRNLTSPTKIVSSPSPIHLDDLFLEKKTLKDGAGREKVSTTDREKDILLRSKNLIRKNLKRGNFVEGRIIDLSTQLPIPFAHIYTDVFGTYSNPKGEFLLRTDETNEEDSIYVSCIGYKTRVLKPFEGKRDIELEPRIDYLQEINIVGSRETPESIFLKSLNAIETNYSMSDISGKYDVKAQGYLNKKLDYAVDYRIHSSLLSGYSRTNASRSGAIYGHRKLDEVNWKKKQESSDYIKSFTLDNYPRAMNDFKDIAQHPIFNPKNIRKYDFKIEDYNAEDSIIILSFKAKRLGFKYTHWFYLENFKGSITIDERDYAIIETAFQWYLDKEKLTRYSEKYVDRKKETFFTRYTDHNIFEKCYYSKLADGKYYLVKNEFRRHISGFDLRSEDSYDLKEKAISELIEIDKVFFMIKENDLHIR